MIFAVLRNNDSNFKGTRKWILFAIIYVDLRETDHNFQKSNDFWHNIFAQLRQNIVI